MLLCEDDGSIFAKVGTAKDPLKRARDIMVACPVPAGVLAYVELPNRTKARQMERELHGAFVQWHAGGEWFKFKATDKTAFNSAWQIVFGALSQPNWPLKWTKINAAALCGGRN